MATATSFTVPNYSGALYTKSITTTPFLNMIGAPKYTNHVEFVLDQKYSLGNASQPAISETASLTAPTPVSVTRTQDTNVTQIFHESIAVSYAREANAGTLSGLNAAGQVENPASELDFQAAAMMQKIRNDVEYTFLNGVYNKATTDATINKTRGILTAITTNNVAAGHAVSSSTIKADLAAFFKTVYDSNTDIDGYVLLVNSDIKAAISKAYEGSGYTTPGITMAGINVMQIMTDFGMINLALDRMMPQKQALLFNPAIVHPVEQPTPGKGNFFMEELAKTGASTQYQIFGQIGLDYGLESMHGKLVFT